MQTLFGDSVSDTLHLHVTYEYFDQIESGEKTLEYREYEKWRKKIEGREYKWVTIWRAYTSKKITVPWRGYMLQTIVHPHFKNVPAFVFAIHLTEQSLNEAL